MTLQEIINGQFELGQATQERPELKARVQSACKSWAENSRKYGIIPVARHFHKGV